MVKTKKKRRRKRSAGRDDKEGRTLLFVVEFCLLSAVVVVEVLVLAARWTPRQQATNQSQWECEQYSTVKYQQQIKLAGKIIIIIH